MDLATARHAFAEELRHVAHIRDQRVVAAFAAVPRERFLGEPPWQVYDHEAGEYWQLPGTDRTAAYHNVLFAIDAARGLNNGHPEFWARLLDRLAIRRGETVFHVGAGLGYYTAILAALAGPQGRVVAAELDRELARRAAANLAEAPSVQVIAADGTAFDPGPVDAVVASAGATHPPPGWLAALRPGGRLLLPLTAAGGQGHVFRIERRDTPDRFAATALCGVRIFPCIGARDTRAERQLARALAESGQRFVRSLRLDIHAADPTCWLHGDGTCLSTGRRELSRPGGWR